jgi:CMP-N,N'-diacetyllegionaminic acid synthase
MEAIAIIPARGGSARVPGKNLLPIAGRPLLSHTIEHALASTHVGDVLVSTDDDEIAALAEAEGAQVVRRPDRLSADDSPSEEALLHALDVRVRAGEDPDLVVFLQATSPARRPGDIDRAIDLLTAQEADSLFSACKEIVHTWAIEDGELRSISYDWRSRARTQDMQPRWRENGSIYVFRPWVLREERNRLGGKIALYEMGFWSSFDLDDADDVELLDWIISSGKVSADV